MGSHELVYGWKLDKSATPASLDIFKGDTATAHYTVTATRDAGTGGNAQLKGQVVITNGGSVATDTLASTLNVTQPPSSTVVKSQALDVSGNPVLDPGETGTYPFTIDLGASAQGTFKVTAATTILNHSGHLGTAFGPSGSWSGDVGAQTVVNGQLAVHDTYGGDHTFTDSGTWKYDQVFTQAGDYPNTVSGQLADGTKVETSATVKVNVYELGVAKAVDGTSLTRTYAWTLGQPTPDTLKVHVGDTNVQYSVPVKVTAKDSDWAAAGTITIKNPAPMDATVTDVTGQMGLASDELTMADGSALQMPLTIPAGGQVVLHVTIKPADGQGGDNVASVTMLLPNLNMPSDPYTAKAAVDFSGAKVTEHGKTATITNHGELKDDNGQTVTSDGTITVSEP